MNTGREQLRMSLDRLRVARLRAGGHIHGATRARLVGRALLLLLVVFARFVVLLGLADLLRRLVVRLWSVARRCLSTLLVVRFVRLLRLRFLLQLQLFFLLLLRFGSLLSLVRISLLPLFVLLVESVEVLAAQQLQTALDRDLLQTEMRRDAHLARPEIRPQHLLVLLLQNANAEIFGQVLTVLHIGVNAVDVDLGEVLRRETRD